jgi:hypothetical protein
MDHFSTIFAYGSSDGLLMPKSPDSLYGGGKKRKIEAK